MLTEFSTSETLKLIITTIKKLKKLKNFSQVKHFKIYTL